jgi:hypothetical protein
MAISLNALRRSAANAFLQSIYTKASRYYFYFSQTTEFDVGSPIEAPTLDYENKTRNNTFAAKEVLPSDACYVIPRVDHVSGTVYVPYSTLTGLGSYVYNSTNFSIYLCVKAGVGNSTIEPQHTSLNPATLGDGYVWRYIYTIPLALRDRFLTAEWIPVSNVLTESFFSNGGIDSVSIIDAGEGYDANSTSIVVTGSSGQGHGAVIEPVVADGKIVSAIIHEPGYGYISPTVTILSPSATRTAIISPNISKGDIRSSQALIQTLTQPGTIESVEVLTGGTGYTTNTAMAIVGDGTGATVSFVRNITTGAITSVAVTNRGEGYTWARIDVTDTPLVGGVGFTAHINLSPIRGFGRDPVSDLGATRLMIYQNLSREKIEGVALENQVRQYGILMNPKTTNSGSYPRNQVTKENFVTSIPLSLVADFTIGTTIHNEFPTTGTTKSFVVEEQIVGASFAGLRVRALDPGDQIVSGARYYKAADVSFVADYATYALAADRQFVSACYVLETESPAFFDINIFTVGKVLTNAGNRYVIVGTSSNTILVTSIDGGELVTGNTLLDSLSNVLTPQTITKPLLDKLSGTVLTIEKTDPITYGQMQSVSFRTLIEF